jgi:hypothetical protein
MTAPVTPDCYYATHPDARPTCQLTATAAVGGLYLCPDCLARRSTLGKGQPVRPLPAPAGEDYPSRPLDRIVVAAARLHQAEQALTAAVRRARERGHSWTEIGERLTITRQAAHQRFGGGGPLT